MDTVQLRNEKAPPAETPTETRAAIPAGAV